jgi:hypothetical protein
MKISKKITLLAATILVGLSQVNGAPTLSQQIDSLPAVEVPAFAVKTVLSAEKAEQLNSAIKVIRTVAVTNEKALVPTVVSITRSIPQFGPFIAAEAARLSPNQAKEIALRVAQAVPSLAADVAFQVVSASKLSSTQAVELASLVVKVAPDSADITASAVAHAVPSARQALVSRFPNAVLFVLPGAITSTTGSLLENQAEDILEELEEIVDNGGTLTPEQEQQKQQAEAFKQQANNRPNPTPFVGTIVDGFDPSRYANP